MSRRNERSGPRRPIPSGASPARALGLVAVLALAAACSDGEAARSPESGPDPVAVEIVEVQPRLLRDVVDLVGQLESELTVQIRSDTEGILETIEFAEGDEVSRGQVLFRLENDEERARLREAKADARLRRTIYERTRRLAGRDIAAQAQLDRVAAELAREEARVEAARAALDKTILRAPFDGRMGAVWVSPGARVGPDVVLTQIDAVERLQLLFTVPERAMALARRDIPVEFGVAPYPGETFRGKVYFVAPTVDPETRRLLVKAWVPNPDLRLRPGLFANIRAEVGRTEDALLVPESALALDRSGAFVWQVGPDGTVEKQPVETGLRVEGDVEITAGLQPGDRIVAVGTNRVQAGDPVRAVTRSEPRTAGPAGEERAGTERTGRAARGGGGDS